MRFSTLIIITALGVAASAGPLSKRQTECPEASNIPACGLPCIQSAATAVGCAVDGYACMCSKFDALRLAAAPCAVSNCGMAGVPALLAAAEAVCAACA
ncbi:hypothetical protein N657DRAFT_694194 [Parathielavia appendiculata]|uniref:CFEM domain-containing protein n=1 Tax=Parathielavia appendiculata TaxID=2587402 RepID=A0AAN6YYF9_9PEZI|nr:hypothetical protein N657DRAFT_694194 [Parathielavia appendiculata]